MLVSRVYLISTMVMWVYVRVGWDRSGVAMIMSMITSDKTGAEKWTHDDGLVPAVGQEQAFIGHQPFEHLLSFSCLSIIAQLRRMAQLLLYCRHYPPSTGATALPVR
jgi:hypothetical protein